MLRLRNADGVFSDQTEELMPMEFQRHDTVQSGVRKVLRLYPVSLDAQQFGFFVSSRQAWLEPSSTFFEALQPGETTLEFRKRYATYHLQVHPDMSFYYQLDDTVTVSQLYGLLELNVFGCKLVTAGSPADYGLFIPGDAEGGLDRSRTVAEHSYQVSQKLEYRPRLQPIHILRSGKQKTLLVDYLVPLASQEEVLKRELEVTDLDPSRVSLLKLGQICAPISLGASLLSQGLRSPATLILSISQRSRSDSLRLSGGGRGNNIYDEPFSDASIRYHLTPSSAPGAPPVIALATLNKLVHFLTDERWTDAQFLRLFLLTFTLFTEPRAVLAKLFERYRTPSSLPPATKAVIKARVLNVIRKMVDERGAELISSDCLPLLEDFVVRVVSVENSQLNVSSASKILSKFSSQFQAASESPVDEEGPVFEVDPSLYCVQVLTVEAMGNWATPAHFWGYPEHSVAEQMTRFDFDIFRNLKLTEFLDQSWSKPSSQHRCPTLVRMIGRFNAVSLWIAFLILEPPRLTHRVQRFESIIRIADELFLLGNFHSLMAILSGLNNAAISRLGFTRNGLHKREAQRLQELEEVMNMEGSYARYRKALLAADPPIIPYIGVYLGDLTFVQDGNPDLIDGLINVDKYRLFFDVVRQIETYQLLSDTNWIDNPAIHRLLTIPLFNDSFLYDLSLQREPRGCPGSSIVR